MVMKLFAYASTLAVLSLPALAGDSAIEIKDAYARSGAKSGAVFFTIMNHSDTQDRLVSASTDVARRVELHTHIMQDGIAKMRQLEGGIVVPAEGMHDLARGGDHVMLMGLSKALEQGATISLTLEFEQAGDLVIDVPVDNDRKGKAAGHGEHSH